MKVDMNFSWVLKGGSKIVWKLKEINEDKENYIVPIPKDVEKMVSLYYGTFPKDVEIEVKQKKEVSC